MDANADDGMRNYLYWAQSTFFMSPLLASSACMPKAALMDCGVWALPSDSFR